MDMATIEQKAHIKGLFVQGGLPDWIFNPSDLWNISKQDADSLITNLRIMLKYDHEDLKDEITQTLEGKHIFQTQTKTIDELEETEEQANCDLTSEDWLEQQIYEDDVQSDEWIHKPHLGGIKKEVIA